ncbi:GPW/gp25 family protein [Chitinispirillales bacterium ANBcel5]|uniref:GPW/gp25 family protein n=1 Tax=Cellulosispirillum alkaliphilum TaxID=3039283 RepID=UPI002A502C7A|nr:GPW/gp25 family protein [Chitinispirillales bacterium ANBcel5]
MPATAWKFDFPNQDFDQYPSPVGLRINSKGGIGMISANASIRQSLLMLLSIAPGERVMYPEYGCSLHKLAFSVNDDTTAGLAIHYIREAIRRWEPRITILRLDAKANPQHQELLEITIEYKTNVSNKTEYLDFTIDLEQKRI